MTPGLMAIVFAIVEQLENLPPDLSVFARYLRACEWESPNVFPRHCVVHKAYSEHGDQCDAQRAVMEVYEAAMRLAGGDDEHRN